MKKYLFAVLMLLAAWAVVGQEPTFEFKRDTLRRNKGFALPDSMMHMSPMRYESMKLLPVKAKPLVSMTSVLAIQRENLPSSVTVLNNNTLRLGPQFNLSNGQAWNWSPFPDAYLDARTLSFPMPR